MSSDEQYEHPPAGSSMKMWCAGIVWLGWWLLALWLLADHWSANPQYTYGWLVPPLAVLLAWRRWGTRPEPDPPPRWCVPGLFVAAAVTLPARVIAQPT